MAFSNSTSRQDVKAAFVPVTFGASKDVTAAGTFSVCQLPQGAVVLRVLANVIGTVGTGTTITIGDTGSANRYLASTTANTAALVAGTATGFKYTSPTDLTFTLAGTIVGTSGKIEFYVEYIREGRADSVQG